MKKSKIIWLLIAILIYIVFATSCVRNNCNTGYCSIEQKRLQSYSEYKKTNKNLYNNKISKITNKYIDAKSNKHILQQSMLNPKFK